MGDHTIAAPCTKAEREHIRLAVEGIERVCGKRPVGWMTGRPGASTRRLLVEEGGFLYDRDALDDEVPYWVEVAGKPHLVVPYSYETNDNRFNENSGFNAAHDFFQYMRDAVDVLYAEGADEPKILSLGIHDRLIGQIPWHGTLPRSRAAPRQGVDLYGRGDRPPLDGGAPLPPRNVAPGNPLRDGAPRLLSKRLSS